MESVRAKVFKLLFGQLVASFLTLADLINEYLGRQNVSVPAIQSLMSFCLLSVVYFVFYLKQIYKCPQALKKSLIHERNLIWYFIASVCDFSATLMIIQSFSHISILNVILLKSLATPTAMIESIFFLGARYRINHFFGLLVTFFGICLLLFSGLEFKSDGDLMSGNILCIASACLYGSSNVIQEHVLKRTENIVELISCSSVFGSVFSLILFAWNYEQIPTRIDVWISLAGFSMSILFFYSFVSLYLKSNSAAMLNISLSAGTVLSLISSLLLFDLSIDLVYFGSFVLVIFGMIVFHSKDAITLKQEIFQDIPQERLQDKT